MLTNVFIIRKNMNKFFVMDPDTGNWDWTMNLEDATIFPTTEKAETAKIQKNIDSDAWIYEIPYSVTTQSRKKKSTSKKRSVKRIIKKKKSVKRK